MKAILTTGALAAALALGACGEGGSDSAATNGSDSATGGTAPAARATPAPNGGQWAEVVSQTPAGGFVIGNPNAPVKIIEYASMTCPHCAAFSEEGLPQLTQKYINTGQASLELRNFVMNGADLAASLLARCSGPGAYFKLTDQMFADQEQWAQRLQAISPADQQRLQAAAPGEAATFMAEQAGLIDFARMRGIPEAKARQCLTNQQEIDRLVSMQQTAIQEYPNFPGTPAFIINGELAENTGTFAALEPKIQEALQ